MQRLQSTYAEDPRRGVVSWVSVCVCVWGPVLRMRTKQWPNNRRYHTQANAANKSICQG